MSSCRYNFGSMLALADKIHLALLAQLIWCVVAATAAAAAAPDAAALMEMHTNTGCYAGSQGDWR